MFQRELRQIRLIEKGGFFRTRPKNCMVTKRQMDLWLGRVNKYSVALRYLLSVAREEYYANKLYESPIPDL